MMKSNPGAQTLSATGNESGSHRKYRLKRRAKNRTEKASRRKNRKG